MGLKFCYAIAPGLKFLSRRDRDRLPKQDDGFEWDECKFFWMEKKIVVEIKNVVNKEKRSRLGNENNISNVIHRQKLDEVH